jgi:hypothetical protein
MRVPRDNGELNLTPGEEEGEQDRERLKRERNNDNQRNEENKREKSRRKQGKIKKRTEKY